MKLNKILILAGSCLLAFSAHGFIAVTTNLATVLDQLCGGCSLTLVQSSSSTFGLFGATNGSGTLICNVEEGTGAAGHPFYVYEYQIFTGTLGPAPGHCLGFDLLDPNDPKSWDLDGRGHMSQIFTFTDSTLGNVAVFDAIQFGFDLEFGFGSFGNPCGLVPGATTLVFGFVSDSAPQTVTAEITDDYDNTQYISEIQTLGSSFCDWHEQICFTLPPQISPSLILQAALLASSGSSGASSGVPTNGMFSMQFQLFDSVTNGNAVSGVLSEQVNVVNGLFTLPLDFGFNSFHPPQPCYLDVAIGAGTAGFTHLTPRLMMGQTPYAAHANEADSVMNLGKGQAVTSVNGLQDNVTLMAGTNISITSTANNTLVISAGVGTAGPVSAQMVSVAGATPEQKDAEIKALRQKVATLEQQTSTRLAALEKALAALQKGAPAANARSDSQPTVANGN